MGVNSLPKTVTRQRRDCDFNLGPSAPKSCTLTTRLFYITLHYYDARGGDADLWSTSMNFMSSWCWLRKTLVSHATVLAPPSTSSDVDSTSAAHRLGVQTPTNAPDAAPAARGTGAVALRHGDDAAPVKPACRADGRSAGITRLPRTCIVYIHTHSGQHQSISRFLQWPKWCRKHSSLRNSARCTQARKTTHGLDGQHQDVVH